MEKNTGRSSLTSYLETAKGKQRNHNKNDIRITTSFTPRTAGTGDFRRVAQEILRYASQFDTRVLLLPWDINSDLGPIHVDDLQNPHAFNDVIKFYVNKPPYVNWQPGVPVYGIGLRVSTDLGKYEFMNRWNIQKRVALSINFAPVQKSNKAFIIGIAVGSSENQDYDVLNEKLQDATGIKGIEVSFQNINQAGISQEFWKIANSKANKANKDKLSREHLRTKYRWAPNALAVYVPTKEAVNMAQKIMIQKYGKLINGYDPVWPDGTSMRFLPIKGTAIKNEKTKEIVRKRLAYHIWMKANEITLDTKMQHINENTSLFGGPTLAEQVLSMSDKDGERVFNHFTRVWSSDPRQKKWAISVRPHLLEEAQKMLNNIEDTLREEYGDGVSYFFLKGNDNYSSWAATSDRRPTDQDDDDDWFDEDDDMEEMIKKGVVDSSFLQFLSAKSDDDRQSVASWGTGDTTYTEIMTNKDTVGTTTSSITLDNSALSVGETNRRRALVRARLIEHNVLQEEIETILNKREPYQLAFSGVHLPTWDVEKEVFLILAIRAQYQKMNDEQNDEETQ